MVHASIDHHCKHFEVDLVETVVDIQGFRTKVVPLHL